MADWNKKHPHNAPGSVYVDDHCIGCYLCAELAPGVFARVNDEDAPCESFIVKAQPTNPVEEAQCDVAIHGCPSDSIGRRDG